MQICKRNYLYWMKQSNRTTIGQQTFGLAMFTSSQIQAPSAANVVKIGLTRRLEPMDPSK